MNNWLWIPTNNFTLKNCLSRTFKLVRNTIKSKFTDNGHGIVFDGESLWRFDNDHGRNVVIFGLDNSLSSQTDKPKHDFLVLGEGQTVGVNNSTSSAEQNLVLTFVSLTEVRSHFFSEHIRYTAKKVAKSNGLLYRTKPFFGNIPYYHCIIHIFTPT